MSLMNDVQTGPSTYEFDVFIKSTSADFNLTSYIVVFTFNTSIANGGTLTFSYIAGSSALSNLPTVAVNIATDVGGISNLTAGSNQGSDNISTTDMKVGRFRITNTLAFASLSANINWDFGELIVTQVNINSIDATNPSNHIDNLIDATLPVELNSFTATSNQNTVNLKWQTATEVNNFGFEIERKVHTSTSLSVTEWEKIGFVNGSGNSNSPKNYSFSDNNPSGGSKFLYRLKQIDNDGQFEYSDAVEVEIVPKEFVLYQNYPNPFNPTTKINYSVPFDSKVIISIYSITGELVRELVNDNVETGSYSVDFNGSNLASGMYIYKMAAGNFVKTYKMMLMK
jgi:hypothetical protein